MGSGAALALSLAGGRQALAQLRVDITRGVVQPMPIAISPFAADSPGLQERAVAIAEVVQNDLDGSGLFKTIDRQAYIQSPDEMRTVPRFPDWRQINAQALVTGVVQSGGGNLSVEFRLWDVFAGSQLRGLRYDSPESGWRRIAHKIADVVYERLTGELGYFDTRVAYISETGPAVRRVKRLAVMDQDGANHRFLTDGSNLVLTPRIAPDGRRVAYMIYRNGPPRIVVKEIDTGREGALGNFEGMTFAPRFSPDGRTLLLTLAQSGNSDIYAFDVGTQAGQPAHRQRRHRHLALLLARTAARSSSTPTAAARPSSTSCRARAAVRRRISYGQGRYGSPAWSPRGDLIAFTNIKGGMFHIGVMKPDGSDERLITRSFMDQSPTWAPNGRVIMFGREDPRGDRARLLTIDITGYNQREVPTPTDASDPDWSPLIP